MRALVTGGYGFIGSNLVRRLHTQGDHVDVVDNMINGNEDQLKDLPVREVLPTLILQDTSKDTGKINFYKADFSSDDILNKIATGCYDVIYHTAALPRVSFSVEHPAETTEVNLMGTVKLFDAARYGQARVVFSSSSSVYGGAEVLPTPASTKKDPKSPYAWQKSAAEDIAKMYTDLYQDSDIVSLRYFNVFGPGQYGDSPYSTAIAAWCHAIKSGTPCRSDGDGNQSRDLCYVDNVVDANILAANHDARFTGQCYNVACGDRISNNEVLEYFKENFNAEVIHAPWRAGDVMHTHADISKVEKEIGYTPRVSFWEGLDRTIDWWGL